jgi:hypothetical protein
MPDGSGHTEFKVVKVHIPPAKCQKFAHAKSRASIQQRQRSFPHAKLTEQELNLGKVQNVRNALPLRALTNELDWVSIYSRQNLVALAF